MSVRVRISRFETEEQLCAKKLHMKRQKQLEVEAQSIALRLKNPQRPPVRLGRK